MIIEKIAVIILFLSLNVPEMLGKSFNPNEITKNEASYQFLDETLDGSDTNDDMVNLYQEDKRALPIAAIYGVISEAIGLASAIQGAVCQFTSVCSTDEINPKLDALDAKLDAIEIDVKAIKKDVEEIWEVSKRKWYFEHIDYMISERKKIIADLKNKDTSDLATDRRNRYIDEVLGSSGKDMYVQKALFQIPNLVTREGLINHYFKTKLSTEGSKEAAAKSTWKFIKKLFRYQEDGYANIIFASALKYKSDVNSFKKSVSEVCAMWNKPDSQSFQEACAKFPKDTTAEHEREKQVKFIFLYRDLFLYPVLEVKKQCTAFRDSDQIVFTDGFLYVSQPDAAKILVVNPDTLETVTTINIPGTECGGKCHPFGIAVDGEHNVLAVSAHNQLEGGNSFVMMYKITGNLKQPASGLTIKHYYTMLQLQSPSRQKADVRGVAFCGGRFAYADYNGVVYIWPMDYRSDEPQPRVPQRNEWFVERKTETLYGYIEYIGCSNDGKRWVVSANERGGDEAGAGGIPSASIQNSEKLLNMADIKVKTEDWKGKDEFNRLNVVKGSAIDSKSNMFYSANAHQALVKSVSGLYERRHNGDPRILREWDDITVKMFGVAADDKGFVFAVQKERTGKCLHKYNVEMEIENLNIA